MDKQVKVLSLDETSGMVRRAFERTFCEPHEMMSDDDYYWVVDVYTDSCVVCKGAGTYFRVAYTIAADGVTFAPKEEWQAVEHEWADKQGLSDRKSTTLVFLGGEVKALGDGRIGGYLVRWGSPTERDLTGEYFTAKTYLGAQAGNGADCLFHHGVPIHPDLKALADYTFAPLKTHRDEIGLFAETVMDMANQYESMVYNLAQKGKLKFSSGAPGHTVRKTADGEITRWFISEGSLTPTPAEWRNHVFPLKAIPLPQFEPEATAEGEKPAGAGTKTADATVRIEIINSTTPNQTHEDKKTMAEETIQTTPPAADSARLEAMEGTLGQLTKSVDAITKALEKLPQSQNPGYFTVDGGTADPNVKSLGDFLLAVKRGDVKRLETVYQSTKAMGEDQGQSGGYLVPEEYNTALLQVGMAENAILNAVQRFPVSSPTGKFPVLDIFSAPTADSGNTALAGGLTAATIAEGGAYTETQAYFEYIQYNVVKVGGYVKVSDELVQDAPVIESLLTKLIGIAVASKKERHVLRGTGAGQPLGIMNAPCAIGISPDTNSTFAFADAAEMESRFMPIDGGKPFWIMHRSMKTDLAAMQVSAGGVSYITNISTNRLSMPLLAYDILFSEHLAQADNSGCAILADLGAYLLFERGPIRISYSEHADFTNGNQVWRFDQRVDGQPWMRAAVTQADPQGSFTTSPFVYFND